MMRSGVVGFVVCCFILPACSPGASTSGPPTPAVFAPGIISGSNVFRGAFTPDGAGFYFFKEVGQGQENFRIYRSERIGGAWQPPTPVQLGGDHSDLYPAVSPDGRRLVFSSYRPLPGDTAAAPNANLWYADWDGAAWRAPVFMAAPSTPSHYDAKPFFGPDGAVYFESTTPDWQATRSLITRWTGTAYGPPEAFEAVEQWRTWRDDLYVWGGVPGPDSRFVILDVSARNPDTGRPGASDQWVSFRSDDGTWTPPKPFGPALNTAGYDNFTFFSPDGRRLFFVRDFDAFYSVDLEAALAGVR